MICVIYIISFFIGFLFNESRIINRTFADYHDFISTKIIFKELGLNIFLFGIIMNFCKGFLVTINTDTLNQTLIILILLLGNYLGCKPGSTNSNELIIMWGVWTGVNMEIIQIPLALLISLWIITGNLSFGFYLGSGVACINLMLTDNLLLALLSLSLLVNYTTRFYSLFELFKNKIRSSRLLRINY